MSTTPLNFSKPSAMYNGMGWKRRMRVMKAAQLTALGVLSDADIARQIGITQPAFSILKTTNFFKSQMVSLATGIIDQETTAICRSHETQREMLAEMVPEALMQLRKFALSSNPAIALKANLEILDRDGNHSKVSRTSVTVENHIDLSAVNVTGNNILNILKQVSPASIPSSVSPEENVVAGQVADDIMASFTKSAADSKTQVSAMADVITEETLETIESASSKVQ
jgi:hypothetical protein